MDSLLRLWPLVRPQRRLLAASILAAAVAAGLWAATMLAAFPICKVLIQGQSLGDYFATEIQAARDVIAHESARIGVLEDGLAELESAGKTGSRAHVRLLQDRSQCQSRASSAAWREWWYAGLQRRLASRLPADRFDTLAVLFGLLLCVTAVHGVAVYFQETWVGLVVQLSLRSLRARLFATTLRMDAQTLGQEGPAGVLARFTNDLDGIAQGLTLLGGKIVLEPFKAGVCLALAFAANWRLTLLSLVCAPLGAFLFQQFGRKLKRASRRQMETVARLYRVLQEVLSAFRVVTAYGQQRQHRRTVYRENRAYYRRAMQIARLDALVNPTVEQLGITAACLAILPGAYLVVQRQTSIFGVRLTDVEMDLASLALLYSLLAGAVDPARKLSSVYSKLKKSIAACERVFGWMDRPTLIAESAQPAADVRHQSSLEFDRVTFTYHREPGAGPARDATLDSVSLRIDFGDVVAIVGGNGSGKSTLVGLLPRFYDPQHGAVRIDGVDIRDLPLRTLRAQIGWVPQEPQLFDRSLAENIADGRPNVSRSEIEDVARRAHVWDFAAPWPQGLDTLVGEKGGRLSGGQRQRLALARAMLREPAILVLDEATSAIDAQSERLIHLSLRDFSRGRTTLVITHALTPELLEFVTKIVVMDRGQVVAVGQHDLLLKTCPAYQALYCAQTARRAA